MPKGVIFDVDGTLIDSADLHAKFWQDAFADYGRTIPFDGIRSQIGVLCGGFPEDSLREAGCIAIYQDPADLLAHYNGSPLAQDPGS